MKSAKLSEENQENSENQETYEDNQNDSESLNLSPQQCPQELEEKAIVFKRPVQLLNIEVRFADGSIRIVKTDIQNEKVLDIKEKLFQKELKESKDCQLIYMGKFLTDELELKKLHGVQEGICMHGRIKVQSIPNQSESKIIKGFESLISAGFSLEEVELMRLNFHGNRVYENDEQRLELEQQWLDGNQNYNIREVSIGIGNEQSQNLQHQQHSSILPQAAQVQQEISTTDFCLGCIVGYILTLFSVFILCCLNINDTRKRGIVFGIILSIGTFLAVFNFAL